MKISRAILIQIIREEIGAKISENGVFSRGNSKTLDKVAAPHNSRLGAMPYRHPIEAEDMSIDEDEEDEILPVMSLSEAMNEYFDDPLGSGEHSWSQIDLESGTVRGFRR